MAYQSYVHNDTKTVALFELKVGNSKILYTNLTIVTRIHQIYIQDHQLNFRFLIPYSHILHHISDLITCV